MRILITGGAGYIGSHTAKMLKEQGHDLLVYDNLSTGHAEAVQGLPLVQGDIADGERLAKVIKDYEITDVIHFAASSIVGESMQNPRKYYLNNVVGTISLLNTLVACKVERIVFSSTAAVYGEPGNNSENGLIEGFVTAGVTEIAKQFATAGQTEPLVLNEDCPLKPTSVYGQTKLIIENALKDYSRAYGLKYISLRYFNACGADDSGEIGEDHQPETHLIPLVLQTALGQRDKIVIFGDDYPTRDGTCIRDYIHVNDLAQAHLLAVGYLREGNASEIFNLGNGEGFSVKEIIRTAEEVVGRVIPAEVGARRSGDPAVLVASSEKAKKLLGWKPQYSELEKMIVTAWKWHQNHPNGYSQK
ncbi:MAG TPA: UDP-glucose 4-epimerase GalE [Peptococcaceae bacterium]|nr:UDP-glucose 4-epimerase GalE [Peptococcaceae bacterium]